MTPHEKSSVEYLSDCPERANTHHWSCSCESHTRSNSEKKVADWDDQYRDHFEETCNVVELGNMWHNPSGSGIYDCVRLGNSPSADWWIRDDDYLRLLVDGRFSAESALHCRRMPLWIARTYFIDIKTPGIFMTRSEVKHIHAKSTREYATIIARTQFA